MVIMFNGTLRTAGCCISWIPICTGRGGIVRRGRNENERGGVPDSQSGTQHYEVIDSEELARRWVLPVSWVRSHVHNRVTDPIPHIRFRKICSLSLGQS
jgi:hypothetical protein